MFLQQFVLLLCAVACCVEQQLTFEPTVIEDRELRGWWWRVPADVAELDSVFTYLFDFQVLGVGCNIAVEINRALQLIQKLAHDVVDVD